MGGSKTSLGFLVLLPIVLFSRTSSGEFGDDLRGAWWWAVGNARLDGL